MKLASLKRKMQSCYPRGVSLVLAVNLLLVSANRAQNTDTGIAFMSNRSGNGEIYLMDPDGKRVRRLTEHPQYDAVPAWSPDGRKIIFMSFRDKDRFPESGGEIYVMNPDGTNLINLTQSPERSDGISTWSPDGKQIAFQAFGIFNKGGPYQGDIWVMDTDGGNPRNLTNHHASDLGPDWSPDGRQIAFSSYRDRAWEFEAWDNYDIYVMNADGTNLINLTKHPAKDYAPDWSPDGRQIAFASNRDGNREVYVMNADGTNLINLTKHPASDGGPDWSPDGQQIVFVSGRDKRNDNDKNSEIYVMNADGAHPINLTKHPAIDGQPAWGSVHPLNVAAKGKLATLWGGVKRAR